MPNVILGDPGIVNGSLKIKYVADPKVGTRKTASLVQKVAAETKDTHHDDVAATTGLPVLYGIYSGMWCKEKSLDEDGPGQHPDTGVDTRIWTCTSLFDSELDTHTEETNPLLRPVVISRDSVVVDERLFYDAITGNPICTVLGEPLYVTGPYVMPVFTFTRYEPYPYSDSEILRLTNAVNANVFRGAPIGTVLMLKVATNEVTVKNVRYEQVSYRAQFRIDRFNPMKPHTWREAVPHAGTWWKGAVSGQIKKGIDPDGVARGTIHNLKADGTIMPDGQLPYMLPVNRVRYEIFPTL